MAFIALFLLLLLIFQYLFMQVLSMMGDNPVIFAPSHRSYGDFILMSYLCFHYKIQIPAIAAGMGKQMHVGSYRYDYTPWSHIFKLLSIKRK